MKKTKKNLIFQFCHFQSQRRFSNCLQYKSIFYIINTLISFNFWLSDDQMNGEFNLISFSRKKGRKVFQLKIYLAIFKLCINFEINLIPRHFSLILIVISYGIMRRRFSISFFSLWVWKSISEIEFFHPLCASS